MVASGKGDSKQGALVSAADVRRVAGPVDDETVAEILKLEPSFQELEIAVGYAQGQGDVADRLGHELTGNVARIYEILTVDQDLSDEDR